jgi:predicted house-cleaning noncanonical NTP pyrophosphatase (MazG superfamily)
MKLVRDHIPEIIEEDGKWCLTRTACDIDEHMMFLKQKIIEETKEFMAEPCYEEAADMLEVIRAFCELYDLQFDLVVNAADMKKKTHGGFTRGIILQKVGNE